MKPFLVTWDYRCPFARNAHEHIVAALEEGADWDVTFVPFSLNQVHVPEGGTPVWEDPDKARDLMANSAGILVRDQYPDRFLKAHWNLFAARHDEGIDLREPELLAEVLDRSGVPGEKVVAEVQSGAVLEEFRAAHEQSVSEWSVFGVPTFIVDGRAVFVRLMNRPQGDAAVARHSIEGVIDLFDRMPELNEFKFTSIAR
jgi:hypothetical protein